MVVIGKKAFFGAYIIIIKLQIFDTASIRYNERLGTLHDIISILYIWHSS